ncbi:hypothetical protein VNO77_12756 [Canavalia gladiata]|uniref:Uncharacterized protein n=1 Tax=Canavalia gladiata TaxID=3824 RepID=A0AAN9M1R8_CANGL
MNSSSFLFTLGLILISHSTLTVNSKDHHGNGPDMMAQVILELALNKGTEGQNFLKGLVQTNNVLAIQECATFHYDGMIGSFRSSLKELEEDPETANYDAKVAGDGPMVAIEP